jgi:dihydrolipoamide dehydrogenase
MLGRWMTVRSNHEVTQVEPAPSKEAIRAKVLDRSTGESTTLDSEALLIASGRAPNTDLLHPEKSGVQTDASGWITVNEYLETSKKNIWAFGDANGKHLYKHVANYESQVVFENAVLGKKTPVDYGAVPHAVFTHPEIAAVGQKEREAVAQLGRDKVMIGFNRFEDTARGQAMGISGCFAKIILEEGTGRILGAHIIGPQASILIQEIISLMSSREQSIVPAMNAMHIHPALSEVIQGALSEFLSPEDYAHMLTHLFPEDFPAS